MNNLEIGIVVEVKGFQCKIATFDNTNHATFIQNGELIKNVSVNSFIIISQGFVNIVARIVSESIWDNQSNARDYNLDRRFSKNTIKRILEVQTIGYLKQGGFSSGASFLPMIGNICSIPSAEDVNRIYINNYNDEINESTVEIGESLVEQNPIKLPVNLFFASHIGIFGNTGSGKSNTLHKLYYELFCKKELIYLRKKSKFLVLDFNGEYNQDESFGVLTKDKAIYNLSSNSESSVKFPIKDTIFFDDEMLSILFSATQQTQKPFLSRVINGRKKYGAGMVSLSAWTMYLIRRILTNEVNQTDIKNRLIACIETNIPESTELLEKLKSVIFRDNKFAYPFPSSSWTFFNGEWTDQKSDSIRLIELQACISSSKLDVFQEFIFRCELQLIADILYENIIPDHIAPLIRRVHSRVHDIESYIDIVGRLPKQKFLQIVSFKNLNHNSKKILSLLISKMYFDKQKGKRKKNEESFHLIIDEAHNILSNQSGREQDTWKDYRLELFEEIIKEGRKFSFFLTISSQRPADISPTILSQVHNFFLHKLVNERDLQIIDNSISTMDKMSKAMLPVLAQGVCIISGTAISMPITVNIDFIENENLRPQSDTIRLTDVWGESK
ncbi:ATP-binding protein [Enterococcus durans]|uniref:ATP-binding protein n=1 Tax=Enterococcus durans TaxID=53345 RepID=UPI001EE90D6A|nr:ATP-binding protein [Enterococcus durans]